MTRRKYRLDIETYKYVKIEPPKVLRFGLILLIIVVIAIIFIGFLFDFLGIYNNGVNFTKIGGGLAMLASVIGLFTFFRRKKADSNIIDALKESYRNDLSIMQSRYENVKTQVDNDANELIKMGKEIMKLEKRKADLNHTILDISARIFFQDQLIRTEDKIISMIKNNKELLEYIEKRSDIIQNLKLFDEELKKSEDSEFINDLIGLLEYR